ncbi:MAG: GTPase HflX [Halieaceae bacterium]|nr:GTPase HflX [Halieaceae bacterium]
MERQDSGDRVVAVSMKLASETKRQDQDEFESLILSAGGILVSRVFGNRLSPSSNIFVGKGKLEEISEQLKLNSANVVIFNHTLTPIQESNLEKELCCRVVDRTGLILDIFAQRAKSHEGKLQVELAQLRHVTSRLVRGWTHLERQKGGIGQRGPGETQLETDRRLIQARVKSISTRLDRVRTRRKQGRKSRLKSFLPTVAIIGYTNAGKSTLFNRLTNSNVYAADKLFATLDPTLRKLQLKKFGTVVLGDTVGFVRDLPHQLVDAFKATLEEVVSSDLLIHVIDASSENYGDNISEVESILMEIGASSLPKIEVFNKADIVGLPYRLERDISGMPSRVWLSSRHGGGIDILLNSLVEKLSSKIVCRTLTIGLDKGRLRSTLYHIGVVKSEEFNSDGSATLSIELPIEQWNRLIDRTSSEFFLGKSI